MITLTDNDPSSLIPSSTVTTSGLSLRIVQPGADDETVLLPIGKCTVGSSDRCQVHLAIGQARPLHCLIVHDGSETSVTRWAPDAQLNGQDFATAPFRPGDCLQIGDVQLSLITDRATADSSLLDSTPHPFRTTQTKDSPQTQQLSEPPQQPAPAKEFTASNENASLTPAATNSTFAPAPTPFEQPIPSVHRVEIEQPVEINLQPKPIAASNSSAMPPRSAASQLEADRLVSQLWTANYGARQRCRKLVKSLRTMRTEASGIDQQIDDLQQQLRVALEQREQIFAQLSQFQTEAVQRESQSSAEIERLISELATAYEKASVAETTVAEQSDHAERLEAELASLQGQREKWEQVRAAGDLQRTKLAQALADREQSIESLQAEFEQLREAANKADASRGQQTAALNALEAELETVLTDRDQLLATEAQSQQYRKDIESALTDSEQNLAVFQLELEKFQITSRQTEHELIESKVSLENLQAEFVQLSEERDQLVTKRTEYQLREQGWEYELSSRDSQIEELSLEIEQLRAIVDDASQSAVAQVSQVANSQQQLDALTTERDQLLVAQAEQAQNILEWEETVAARDRRIEELEEEHDGICQVLQSVEKGAFEQVDSCNKLENQLASLRAERDQLATALPEQQEYIKRLEQALAERDGQIALLSDELTKTTERQYALEIELAQGTSAYQALETELGKLSTRCEQLVAAQSSSDQSQAAVEQTLAEYQERVEALQQQIDTTEQQRHELEQVAAAGSHSNATYQAELNVLQTRYEQLTSEYQAETERSHQLEGQLAEQQQEAELFHVDLKSVRVELGRTAEQLSSLQSEREMLNQQITGLREELAAQEKVGDGADLQLQQQRDALASELVSARQELEEVREQARAADGDANISTKLVTQLEEEKSPLQQHIEQQDQQAQQLATELQDVRSQLTTGQSELEQLSRLHQQSQSELEQAHQCLRTAEQALQERVVGKATVEEPASEEVAEVSAESLIGPLDAAAAEPCHESPTLDEAYATEETYRTEDNCSPAAEDLATDDLVIDESTRFDEVAASSAAWAESFAADEQPHQETPDVEETYSFGSSGESVGSTPRPRR